MDLFWAVIGCELGSGHTVFLGEFGMGPIWVMWKDVWLEISDGTWLGNLEGWFDGIYFTGPRLRDVEIILVRKFGTAPGWGDQKDFWLGNVNVKCLVKRIEMWSGGPKEDDTCSNERVRAW